ARAPNIQDVLGRVAGLIGTKCPANLRFGATISRQHTARLALNASPWGDQPPLSGPRGMLVQGWPLRHGHCGSPYALRALAIDARKRPVVGWASTTKPPMISTLDDICWIWSKRALRSRTSSGHGVCASA